MASAWIALRRPHQQHLNARRWRCSGGGSRHRHRRRARSVGVLSSRRNPVGSQTCAAKDPRKKGITMTKVTQPLRGRAARGDDTDRKKVTLGVVAVTIALLAAGSAASARLDDRAPAEIQLLTVSDWHGQIVPLQETAQ